MRTSLRRLSALIGVPVMAGAVCVSTAGPALASNRTERAIVVLKGGAVTAPGVRVLSHLDAMHLELVEASPYALRVLAGKAGVSGITPDTRVQFLGKDNGKDNGKDKTKAGDTTGVYASDGLGGAAGHDGAGAGVDVAIIDTGVSDTAALNRASGRLIDAVDTSGLVDDGAPITETGVFSDGYGHGTFMANLIAGGSVDGKHNLGIAPAARVHVVKVADSAGASSLFSVLVGLNWVAWHADTIKVANLALGVERPSDAYGPDPLNVATEWVRAVGVTVVVAAGNTAGEVTDPGFTAGVLTVGAADLTDHRAAVAAFSGSGVVAGVQKPDVVATGVSVLSLLPPDSTVAVQNPGSLRSDGLYRGSGTSEATAVVSGLAAIFVQNHPDAETTEVKSSLRAAARPLSDNRAGTGLAQTTRDISNAAGDGEDTFDGAAWMAGAYSGNGFTTEQWLSDLAEAWFGDATLGQKWMGQRWLSSSWTGQKWMGQKWLGQRWVGQKWLGQKWLDAEWSGQRWVGQRWVGQKWLGQRWVGQKWLGQRWMSVSSDGASS